MKFSTKKTSLTLVGIALLSASSFSQAEWNSAGVALCGLHGIYAGISEEYILSTGQTVKEWDASLREDLRQQASASASNYNVSFSLEPRYLTNEVSIINTDPNNPINISDRDESIQSSDEYYAMSSVKVRSFDLDPNQVLTGRSTISGPGIHYLTEETVRFGDLPIPQVNSRRTCISRR